MESTDRPADALMGRGWHRNSRLLQLLRAMDFSRYNELMASIQNELGQPIGFALPEWSPPPAPPREPMEGRLARLEPLDPARHAQGLHAANAVDADGRNWTYINYGPFPDLESYRAWMSQASRSSDPLFFAIVDKATGEPLGVASYLRIAPASGAIEVGHIVYSNRLKRHPIATEAMYLMMARAFELGYRRYEWKCDALNAASRRAAQRLGFSYEGIFRQATVYKHRNRDTAWYAVIDSEWPQLRDAFRTWLDPRNFDADGHQQTRLSELTGPILKRRG